MLDRFCPKTLIQDFSLKKSFELVLSPCAALKSCKQSEKLNSLIFHKVSKMPFLGPFRPLLSQNFRNKIMHYKN